ncbi:hypothetical protein [Erwinia tasmaniensis]|uniref:hypothetical protein n=1 Tax=Erwinia tasmaniensis TaxID=338565 RepID=UPI003A4E3296
MSEVMRLSLDMQFAKSQYKEDENGNLVYYKDYAALKEDRDALAARVKQLEWDSVFIPKDIEAALAVMGVALPESKEEFNFSINRWVQRLVDRVIRIVPELDAERNNLRAEGAASVGTLIRACAHEFPDSAEDIVEECAMIADNRATSLRSESAESDRDKWKEAAIAAHEESELILAKLAELENQKPLGYTAPYALKDLSMGVSAVIVAKFDDNPEIERNARDIIPLFTRPAPAVSLAKLVPVNAPMEVVCSMDEAVNVHICDSDMQKIWSIVRAATLRLIEEAK